MEIAVFILIIAGCILCHLFSKKFNEEIEDKYGQGCVSVWWSVIIAVLTVATLFASESEHFWIFCLLAVIFAVIGGCSSYNKVLDLGGTQKEALSGFFAQLAGAVGITATILFILIVISGFSSRRRKRR